MRRKSIWLLAGVVVVAVGAVLAAIGPGAFAQEDEEDPDRYAQIALAYAWGTGVEPEAAWRLKQKATGAPDARGRDGYVSLGHAANKLKEIDPQTSYDPRDDCEGYLILAWQTVAIVHDFDENQPDFTVFEVGTNAGADGVPENMFVFAGTEETVDPQDDIDWYYVGEFGAPDGSGGVRTGFEVDPGKAFNYVALCDKADGTPPSSGTAGPDIDAVAAHSWQPSGRSATEATSGGAGNQLNDVDLPDGAKTIVSPADTAVVDGELEFNEVCLQKVAPLMTFINVGAGYRDKDEQGNTIYIESPAEVAMQAVVSRLCARREAAASEALMAMKLVDGDGRIRVMDDALGVTVHTSALEVTVDGRTSFKLNHDAEEGATIVTAEGGPLTVTPAHPPLRTFFLPKGYSARVTQDSVGAPYADARVFTPLVRSD